MYTCKRMRPQASQARTSPPPDDVGATSGLAGLRPHKEGRMQGQWGQRWFLYLTPLARRRLRVHLREGDRDNRLRALRGLQGVRVQGQK